MEVPEDEPGFLAWHQSSARLKLRLSFPLNWVQSRACTAKLFFYFLYLLAFANLARI